MVLNVVSIYLAIRTKTNLFKLYKFTLFREDHINKVNHSDTFLCLTKNPSWKYPLQAIYP